MKHIKTFFKCLLHSSITGLLSCLAFYLTTLALNGSLDECDLRICLSVGVVMFLNTGLDYIKTEVQ